VQHVDLVPTILDLARAPAPGNLPGRSLKPLLDGGRFPSRIVYSESLYGRYHFGWSPLTTITDGRYRYINAPPSELYDLEPDPGDQINLAQQPPASSSQPPAASERRLTDLRAQLDRLTGRQLIADPTRVAADDQERFDALGYVGALPARAKADE